MYLSCQCLDSNCSSLLFEANFSTNLANARKRTYFITRGVLLQLVSSHINLSIQSVAIKFIRYWKTVINIRQRTYLYKVSVSYLFSSHITKVLSLLLSKELNIVKTVINISHWTYLCKVSVL